jgi:hypothetical protein
MEGRQKYGIIGGVILLLWAGLCVSISVSHGLLRITQLSLIGVVFLAIICLTILAFGIFLFFRKETVFILFAWAAVLALCTIGFVLFDGTTGEESLNLKQREAWAWVFLFAATALMMIGFMHSQLGVLRSKTNSSE